MGAPADVRTEAPPTTDPTPTGSPDQGKVTPPFARAGRWVRHPPTHIGLTAHGEPAELPGGSGPDDVSQQAKPSPLWDPSHYSPSLRSREYPHGTREPTSSRPVTDHPPSPEKSRRRRTNTRRSHHPRDRTTRVSPGHRNRRPWAHPSPPTRCPENSPPKRDPDRLVGHLTSAPSVTSRSRQPVHHCRRPRPGRPLRPTPLDPDPHAGFRPRQDVPCPQGPCTHTCLVLTPFSEVLL